MSRDNAPIKGPTTNEVPIGLLEDFDALYWALNGASRLLKMGRRYGLRFGISSEAAILLLQRHGPNADIVISNCVELPAEKARPVSEKLWKKMLAVLVDAVRAANSETIAHQRAKAEGFLSGVWATGEIDDAARDTFAALIVRAFKERSGQTDFDDVMPDTLREPTLSERDHINMDSFFGLLLDAAGRGKLSRDDAISKLAHIVAAVDIGNYAEAKKWFESGHAML